MSKNNEDGKLTDHNYDGIQELDNQLPRWWLATFYITIVFAAVYYAHYELGEGKSIAQEFQQEVSDMEAQAASVVKSVFPDSKKLLAVHAAAEQRALGKAVFQSRCVSCHGDKAQGLIGPNLTDSYWLHGDGKLDAIAKTIHDGVAEKGMPPWGPLLTEDEIYQVTSYVKSLGGSNPPGAKAPQGNLVKE